MSGTDADGIVEDNNSSEAESDLQEESDLSGTINLVCL